MLKNKDLTLTEGAEWVSQTVLARELGITDRRVRQLVKEHVLPEAREGRYDLSACQRRFDLYRNSVDASNYGERGFAWKEFEAQLVEDERRVNALLKDVPAIREQVQSTSLAVQSFWSDMRFLTVCWSKSEAERDLFLTWNEERENAAMAFMLGRALHVLADENGLTFEQVQSKLLADCNADEAA